VQGPEIKNKEKIKMVQAIVHEINPAGTARKK